MRRKKQIEALNKECDRVVELLVELAGKNRVQAERIERIWAILCEA